MWPTGSSLRRPPAGGDHSPGLRLPSADYVTGKPGKEGKPQAPDAVPATAEELRAEGCHTPQQSHAQTRPQHSQAAKEGYTV